MRVLAVEPFYGGSHKAFLDSIASHSQHDWTLLTGSARHWKWRMRNAPLDLAQELFRKTADRVDGFDQPFDAVFCTDMLDLPQWRGFLCRSAGLGHTKSKNPIATEIAGLPTIVYFHENQWTYPQSPHAREDAHYGYTNLLTALSGNAVWFNSDFHRAQFLNAAREFVAKMPDGQTTHDLESLSNKSRTIVPGFSRVGLSDRKNEQGPLRIGWVSRWEYDKRPDQFLELLRATSRRQIAFELVLLGPRTQRPGGPLAEIQSEFSEKIRFDGFADSREQYVRRLREMDVVVSTAEHEFFGIAILEAISAGAIPVLPNRLSYPELVDQRFLYETASDAVDALQHWSNCPDRMQVAEDCARRIDRFETRRIVEQVDLGIAECIDSLT